MLDACIRVPTPGSVCPRLAAAVAAAIVWLTGAWKDGDGMEYDVWTGEDNGDRTLGGGTSDVGVVTMVFFDDIIDNICVETGELRFGP
jgi:hypothetical protein